MLNIARSIYSAYNTTGQRSTDLNKVEIVPIGDSVNEKNKIKNLTKKFTNIAEHDNIPLPGFTLFSSGRRSYGSAETWLIIDPRGFLVRITSQNLMDILLLTGITEGLIQEKCVWARDNTETKMILVPISSPKYIEAENNTRLIENKVNKKTVQLGDTVFLQNSLTGVYLGHMSLYGPIVDYSINETYQPQVFPRREVIEVSPGKFHYMSNLNILKIVERTKEPLSKAEALARANKNIESSFFTSYTDLNSRYFGIRGKILHASQHTVEPVISFVEIDHYEATGLFYDGQDDGDFGKLLLVDKNNRKFLIDYPYSFTSNTAHIHSFNVCEIKSPEDLDVETPSIQLLDRRNSMFKKTAGTEKLDNFVKYYKIVKHVKDHTFV